MITHYLRQIQHDGLLIDTTYDIGAHSGSWTQYLKSTVLPDSKFYLFEADQIHELELQSLGLPYFIGVLSNPGREYVEFFNTNSTQWNTGSSYYKENSAHFDSHPSVRVPCKTIGSIISEHGLPIPNLLKMDTQGSELDILKGIEHYLDKIDLIYLECPIIKYNLGAPNLQDYLDYMRDNGFVPTEVLEIHKSEHIILQIDIMFINHKTKERLYGKTRNTRPLEK